MPGTEAADLSRVYADYHARVVAYATRLLGPGEAEDVAQDVFIKVGRSLHTLADRSKLGPWIYAITLNTVRDVARRRAAADRLAATGRTAADDARAAPTLCEELPDSTARTPEETMERDDMVACYLGYVERLPRAQYEVYVLSEFEDLSNEEISRCLSLSLATVKIRLHRARARLHDDLRQNCQCYRNRRGELMGEPRRP